MRPLLRQSSSRIADAQIRFDGRGCEPIAGNGDPFNSIAAAPDPDHAGAAVLEVERCSRQQPIVELVCTPGVDNDGIASADDAGQRHVRLEVETTPVLPLELAISRR